MSKNTLPDAEVREMLAKLRDHFGEPVAPVSSYCKALETWRQAVRAASEKDPENSSLAGMISRIDEVSTDVYKSNLLYRLIYLEEGLRTEPCPIHKGSWSGCVAPERECPYCMSGSDVTGWVRLSDRMNAGAQVYEVSPHFKSPTFVYLGTTLLAPESMVPNAQRPFIFTITAVELDDRTGLKTRCVGWFESLEQAEEHLYGNYGDIHEGGSVPWAVIEKCESGVCPYAYKEEDRWYRFVQVGNEFKYTVERIEKPEQFEATVGFGLG